MTNKMRRKGRSPKLDTSFPGPYTILKALPEHMYNIECRAQVSVLNESRLKLFRPCNETCSQAPKIPEVPRCPNTKGAVIHKAQSKHNTNLEDWPLLPTPVHLQDGGASLRVEESDRGTPWASKEVDQNNHNNETNSKDTLAEITNKTIIENNSETYQKIPTTWDNLHQDYQAENMFENTNNRPVWNRRAL